LVSLVDFDREDVPLFEQVMAAYFSKVVTVFGGLWFLLMMEWSLSGREFWRALLLSLGSAVIGGVVFASLIYVTTVPSLRKQMRKRLSRIFSGDPALIPPAPGDATHRLICGLILGRSRAGGAILYIRQESLTLQLNYPVGRWWSRATRRAPDPLEIGPPAGITLEQRRWLQIWWHRVLARHEPEVILIHWPEGTVALRVPMVSETFAQLQGCIDNLRGRSASPRAAV
jgi:hypothetical protein